MSKSSNNKVDPKVINLSSKVLSENEIKILEKGLKFTPTPQRKNIEEISNDTAAFCRRLRLAEFFIDKDSSDDSLVANPSNFNPPRGRNQQLDKYIDYMSKFPIESLSQPAKSNITKIERDAIERLRKDTNVVIKEADKGNAVVIMDREYYKSLCLSILQDESYYEETTNYSPSSVFESLAKIIQEHGSNLTKKEVDYLLDFDAKTSNFYGLPKIHKSKSISEQCEKSQTAYIQLQSPTDLKVRPIVAGPTCETHRISNLLDILLKPFIANIRSYVRDTVDFLNTLPKQVSQDSVFVSFDATNLYSNIPHELGLEAIEYWLDRFPNSLHYRYSKKFVLESLKLILQNNFMHFNGKIYRQKLGTAMGTKVAPTYATLVLGYLEIKLYEKVGEKFGEEFKNNIIKSWKRYLDDCFIVWEDSIDKLMLFHEELNSLNPNIKFTIEYDQTELPFLDVMVIKRQGCIITDIYYKSTDTKQYLLFNSCHPRHTKNNVPYNLARRICTIVSDNDLLDLRLHELHQSLKQRNYPQNLILHGIQQARSHPRQDLLQIKNKTDKKVLPFVSTFNPKNPEFFQVLRSNATFLQQDATMQRVLNKFEIIKSKRQSASLKKILTKAKFSDEIPTETENYVQKCNNTRCGTCPFLQEGKDFKFKSGSKFTVRSSFNCTSSNLLYVITCNGCGENYIGQTGDTLRHRMTVHRQQIREPKYQCTPVSGHIRNCAKDVFPNFTVFPFYKFHKKTTEIERENKESLFISKFNPVLNAFLK